MKRQNWKITHRFCNALARRYWILPIGVSMSIISHLASIQFPGRLGKEREERGNLMNTTLFVLALLYSYSNWTSMSKNTNTVFWILSASVLFSNFWNALLIIMYRCEIFLLPVIKNDYSHWASLSYLKYGKISEQTLK